MIRPDLNAIPDYVQGKPAAADAVKLSSNEVTFQPLPAAAQAMADAAAHANRYPDMGAHELRTALSQHLNLPVEQIAVGTGSSALCQQLVQITSTPDSEVIFPWRSFEAYPIFVRVVGATPVAIPLTASGHNDLEAMAAAITERTSLIFVCNPNNPTGTTITNDAFLKFMEAVPSHVIVALDEAYFEFSRAADSPNAAELLDRFPNLVGLRTFSKAYGLAGVRVGYAFGPAPVMSALNKVAVPFGVSSVAQAGALASLEARSELAARVQETIDVRDSVSDALGAGKTQANFVWIPASEREPYALAEAFAEHGVIVRAFPEGVRITVTNASETSRLLEAWEAIK
ncbi:histidinol-phosphate transaminase [Corynebacterium renale]|uniref:Aromatic amino acid aminotransferase n=1 Tax=Corynebacterium renale TaxID=1724 RepID=A0A2A9DLG2_9CORY|nr:histidinol-phosphate transaminase [Corynebacterium renale]PFG27528.1 histidinol-phosphate aminotransferase [Corynebacterium renale]SQI23157.1 Phenylalanine aminotransferase [Corynebacterium renale]